MRVRARMRVCIVSCRKRGPCTLCARVWREGQSQRQRQRHDNPRTSVASGYVTAAPMYLFCGKTSQKKKKGRFVSSCSVYIR